MLLQLATGKSLNSLGFLSATQERGYKKRRREGFDITRAEWMQSTILTDREKRCIKKSWEKREAKVSKRFHDRTRYLTRRVKELQERVDSTSHLIDRLRQGLLGDIVMLLYRDADDHDADVVGVVDAAGGAVHSASSVSAAQRTRLYRQAMVTSEVFRRICTPTWSSRCAGRRY